jgi:hypothetical protein
MLTRLLHLIRHNVIALIALFVALGGTSYAALNLPAGSVGTPQLKNRSVTASKLNPSSVAASVRAWAALTWDGVWRVRASSSDIRVKTTALGETVSWPHTRFPSNCMASVTPTRNFLPPPGGALHAYVNASFSPRSGSLDIEGVGPNGAPQAQSANVLIMCPSPGSQKVNR